MDSFTMTNFSIKLEELGQEYAVSGFDDHMIISTVTNGRASADHSGWRWDDT